MRQYAARASTSNSIVHSTSSFGGKTNTIVMTTTHTMATAFTAGPRRPRLHGAVARVANSPRPRRRLRQLRKMGMTEARESVTVLVDVRAVYAAAYTARATANAL